jgi:hypothetical protein
MKRILWMLALGSLVALPALAKAPARSWSEEISAADLRNVNLDIPVGELIVEGWDRPEIHLDVEIQCPQSGSLCREAAADTRLVTRSEDGTLRIRIEEWPRFFGKGMHARVEIQMPRSLAVEIDLGVGEVRVAGLENDVQTDVGVGEINVSLSESAVAWVRADTGVGEASLRAGGHRYESSGLMVHELRWDDGPGTAEVRADCGVGEINVTLVP